MINVKLSERYALVDGYLVHTGKDGRRRLEVPGRNVGRMAKAERSVFREHERDMPDLSNYKNSEYDLFSCSSELLFETVEKEKKYFYRSDGGKKLLQLARSRSKDRQQASEFEVIPLVFSHNKRKYLYYRSEQPITINDETDPHRITAAQTKGAILPRLSCLQLHKVVFDDRDISLIHTFLSSEVVYIEESAVLLQHMYSSVRIRMLSRPFVRTSAKHNGYEQLPKELESQTIRKYGGLFAFTYFVLLRLEDFSFTTLKVNTKHWDRSSLEEKAKRLSTMFHAMLTVPEMHPLLHLLVRLNGIRIDDPRPSMDTTDKVRRKLDAFKEYVMYSTLYNSPDEKVRYFTGETSSEWSWIKDIYDKVKLESLHDLRFMISYQPPDCLRVSGKSFSRGYIRSLYSTCEERFEEILEGISEFYEMPSVKMAAFEVLDDPNAFFGEDLLEPKRAFQNLVNRSALSRITPKRLKPTDSLTPLLIEALDECTVLLMWMIYLTCGSPYRYPELLLLKFAGSNRNIFVDQQTRCILLWTGYPKLRGSRLDMKMLSKNTSNYVFFYIMVLRPIQVQLAGKEYDKFRRDISDEVKYEQEIIEIFSETGESLDGRELSQQVLRMHLCVDISKGNLVKDWVFESFLEKYPSTVPKALRLGLRDLRYGMVGLLRKYVKAGHLLRNAQFEAVKEQLAAHSVTIADPSSATSIQPATEFKLEVAVSQKWNEWLSYDGEVTAKAAVTGEVYSVFSPPMSSAGDVMDIAESLGIDLRREQVILLIEIYLSDSEIIPIQAPAGFGKTLMYEIPMLALKEQRVVSFVFVPSQALLEAATRRLRKNGLRVGIVRRLLADYPQGNYAFEQVYVGTFDDLGNEYLVETFEMWRHLIVGTELGMLVIDQCHNLYEDKEFRSAAFAGIPKVAYSHFWKVVLLTATASSTGMKELLRYLSFDERTRIWDFVGPTP
ncbi:LAFA_0B08394g1_1 [Lachancea sp. 'fantastica']|nr:LAFA_0B08394g1_1 [Lachancea sp. 'fantastica']